MPKKTNKQLETEILNRLRTAAKYTRRTLLQLADDLGDGAIDYPEKADYLNSLSDAATELECKLHAFQEGREP